MAAGEQVSLEPALALVFRQHLHDLPDAAHRVFGVVGLVRAHPLLVRRLVDGLQPVRRGLVRTEDAEVLRVRGCDGAQPLAEHPRRLGDRGAALVVAARVDGEVAEVGQFEGDAQFATVGVGRRAHAQLAVGGEGHDVVGWAAGLVEQLVGAVAAQPRVEVVEVFVGVAGVGERHLVAAPVTLGDLAVDRLRARPTLRRAEDDHRPVRTLGVLGTRFGGLGLDAGDVVEHLVEQRRETAVDRDRILVVEARLEHVRRVAIAAHEGIELLVADAGEHRRIRDLVAVEVQHGQDDAVGDRVDELVRVPRRRERPRLRLAVTDDGEREQFGVVEDGPVGVAEGVTQLSALVDRAGRLGCRVRRDAAGEAELLHEPAQARLVEPDVRVDLRVRALEVGVGDHAGAAVAGAGDVDRRLRALGDDAVEVGVEEVEPGRGTPVPEQAMLDVVARQRLAQQGVVEQVDLPDRQVVGGAPPAVDRLESRVGELGSGGGLPGGRGADVEGHASILVVRHER